MALYMDLRGKTRSPWGAGAGAGAGDTGAGLDPGTSEALKKAIARYQPGGGYGKGTEAAIERGHVKAVAGGMQGLVSAGLAGTTMMGGLGKKYEEEVAMPARARVEETRAQKLSELQVLKAQITQGATEAARTRALQKYIAQLQSGTQLAARRSGPSLTPTGGTPSTGQGGEAEAFPYHLESQREPPGLPTPHQGGGGGPIEMAPFTQEELSKPLSSIATTSPISRYAKLANQFLEQPLNF